MLNKHPPFAGLKNIDSDSFFNSNELLNYFPILWNTDKRCSRNLKDFISMASKSRNPAVHKKHSAPKDKNDHRTGKKSGSSDITNPQVFRKINPPDLPVISINCAGHPTHIRNALIIHCQRELGPIPKMFIDRKYQEDITVGYDAKSLSKENDPLGLEKARIISRMKQADLDNLAYEKSKAKLYGTVNSMTT